MRRQKTFLGACLAAVIAISSIALGTPLELFHTRVLQGYVQFAGIDPSNIGDPLAAPRYVAQLDDYGSFGRLGAHSRGLWEWEWGSKVLAVVASTAWGGLMGAGIGTAVPGLGTTAGTLIGAGAGLCASVGNAIVTNSEKSNLTQDFVIFDTIVLWLPESGQIDVLEVFIESFTGATREILELPGASLFLPEEGLFEGSRVVDIGNNALDTAEVEVGVIDLDGDLSTTYDATVIVAFQDFERGIHPLDLVKINLDPVLGELPSYWSEAPIHTRSIFGQTLESSRSLQGYECLYVP